MNKELPNSPDSEKVILGAIIADPSLLEPIREQLSPERFYLPSNRKVYSVMLALRDEGVSVEVGLIVNELKKRSELESAGGTAYVLSLAHGVPAVLPKAHIAEVIRLSRKRSIMQFAERFSGMASSGEETEDELLQFAAHWIDRARSVLPHQGKVKAIAELMDAQEERYARFYKGVSDAVPTGFSFIDDHLLGGGFVGSSLYILAARPSMGKTALALDIAANIAQENHWVYFVSREMPPETLIDRIHAAGSGVARWKLRPGIYQKEFTRLMETSPLMRNLPIVIDNQSLSVSDVRAQVREQERKYRRPEILIIDYIQMLDSKGRTRNDEVGAVTRALKGLAMEFQIPVLGLSQLSREMEKQKREPELSDLRDSGEIEQDADAVFFLFGERQEEHAKIYSRLFKCAKQRDGELFRADLTFNGEFVTFRSFEQLTMQGGIQ